MKTLIIYCAIICFTTTLGRTLNGPDARDLVLLEKIPNYPGLYFVPQYWLLVASETWEVR